MTLKATDSSSLSLQVCFVNLDANTDDCSDEQVKQVTDFNNMHSVSSQDLQDPPIQTQIKILALDF